MCAKNGGSPGAKEHGGVYYMHRRPQQVLDKNGAIAPNMVSKIMMSMNTATVIKDKHAIIVFLTREKGLLGEVPGFLSPVVFYLIV